MEDNLKQRQSKKHKNRQVRKGATYGQRLQPNQCVSYSRASGATNTDLGEETPTFTKSGKGMKKQPYSHYVVLDFEATCDNNKTFAPQEIIEFPAVILNSDTLAIEAEIQQYCRPVRNPTLTAFCTELTGIKQESVDAGILLKEAIEGFDKWLQDNKLSSFTIVTCGDWDLKTMLRNQCRREGLKMPLYFKNWVNIKELYEKFYNRKAKGGMAGMLGSLRLELDGRHHCGLDDCKNIAKIVRKMIEDGCIIANTSQIHGESELYAPTAVTANQQEQQQGEEKEDEEEKEKVVRRRVTVYKNGVKSNGRGMLVETDNFATFAKLAGNKLRMKKATRVFSTTGTELFSVEEIKLDDELFISDGADFIQIHHAEDNFFERTAPEDADLALTWVDVGGEGEQKGRFCLYHRPRRTHGLAMKNSGVTHIVTLLGHKEKGEQIGEIAKAAELKWIWLPLVNGDPPKDSEIERIHEGIKTMAKALTEEGGSLLIHCSAGIHRTGMISNALLQYMGLSPEDAKAKILKARQITGEEVGEHRLAWGQKFISAVGTFEHPK